MSSLTRYRVPESDTAPEHFVDLCEKHDAGFEERLNTLAKGGVLPGEGSNEERQERQRNLRETVQQEKLDERVEKTAAPEDATCMLCALPKQEASSA